MHNKENLGFNELKSKYKKYEHRMRYSLFFFSLLIAFIFTLMLSLVVSTIHSLDKQWNYVFTPLWTIWFLHGIFITFIIFGVTRNFIFKRILGSEQCKEFKLYLELKAGTDGKLLFLIFAISIIGVSCITLPVFIDCYIKIGVDEIVIDSCTSLRETVYSIQDVDRIVLVKSQKNKKGAVTRRKYHEIHFVDGYVFTFDKDMFNPTWSEEIQAMNFIAEKIGDDIIIVDPFPKIGELRE